MPLYLDNETVERLVSPAEAADVIDQLFRDEAAGKVQNRPTTELDIPNGFFRLKAGVTHGMGSYGFKAYGGVKRPSRYIVFVYSLETGYLDGIVEAYKLTEIRTGAVTAVGVRHMARPEARTLGIIGSGREARQQLTAVATERKLASVKVYSRNADRREAYAQEMAAKLGLPVVAVASSDEAVNGVDILVTITSANEPVMAGRALSPGTFICAVGATTPNRRELDEEAVARCGTIVVEHLPQASTECGELLHAATKGLLDWGNVVELKDVVGGRVPGRRSADEINLFDTIGTGAEDIAIATFALRKAREQGLGKPLDF